jgi:type IV pilus assembly protein PilQ
MRSSLVAISALLLVLDTGQAEAQAVNLTGIRMVPTAAGPELTIELSGSAGFTDFTLDNPARIVVDLQGATNALPAAQYAVNRAGVLGVRASQFAADVVRVVIDLAAPTVYAAGAAPNGIVVLLENNQTNFAAFNTTEGAALAGVPAPTIAPGTPGAPQEQPRITVTFQDVDIRDVIASFSEFTGRSIVPGANIEGTVFATIIDQPWDVALQAILRAHNLAAEELPSGIIQVDAIENLQERQTLEALVTQTFRANYVPVAELATSLASLSSERGAISTNPSTNTLIVTDIESVLDAMATILQQLDVRTPQVSIQAKIIFVNRTDVEELGITYDLKDSQGSSLNELVAVPDPFNPGQVTNTNIVSLGGNSIAALGNANVRVQQPQLEALLSLVLGRHTLIAFIDALESQELSDVQAAPLITTLDNQQAEIWVGERTPIRVVDVGTGGAAGTGAAAPRATAELVETGIRLRVTPHITADRRILMELHAERSSAQLAATDIGVIFQQQQGTTRLMVEDGETAVIGGLTVTELGTTRAGIPFLMDLPYVGALFRTTREREQKRDLLIMVTPRIVEGRT